MPANPDQRIESLHRPPSRRLRMLALFLRAAFIVVLVILTARVSFPQNEKIWSVYETPGDLVRLALGALLCVWIAIHLFRPPKDPEASWTWVYFSLFAVPFVLICLFAIW
ncbi:hypothetical protein SAMN05443247_11893 [Bradyrhizobium erythrophlei]|nr:hypothetical protein SAMN05443247_08815 [Bradyrhizobium erythrophlei]SIO67808.1 hypothetical protein SAMN05443247_11893 [Bradyrhizobium erythrophlei]